jgi:hypothetical protein
MIVFNSNNNLAINERKGWCCVTGSNYLDNFSVNSVYQRIYVKLFSVSLIGYIRVVSYDGGESIKVIYFRAVTCSKKTLFNRLVKNFLKLFLDKSNHFDGFVSDIRDCHILKKFPFMGDEFTSVKRDRVLDSLLENV